MGMCTFVILEGKNEYGRIARRTAKRGGKSRNGVNKRWMRRQDRRKTTMKTQAFHEKTVQDHEEAGIHGFESKFQITKKPQSKDHSHEVHEVHEVPWHYKTNYRQVLERYLAAQIGGHWHAEVYEPNPWILVK